MRVLAAERGELPALDMFVCDGGSSDATPDIVARLSRELPFVHLLRHPATRAIRP